MKKQRTDIEVAKLQLNTGQLDWLPANPRQWTREDLDKTKNSITQDSDFLEDRPILVVPLDDAFVVFGGNLRTASSRDLGLKTIPAVIYVPETDADRETIKRRTILDNGSFGAWDFDALANEWDDLPLTDWGVPVWKTEDEEEPKQPKDISDQIQNEFKVEVTCVNEAEQEQLYNKLIGEGYECRILTL